MSRVNVKISVRVSNRSGSRCKPSPCPVRQSTEYGLFPNSGTSVEKNLPYDLVKKQSVAPESSTPVSNEWNMPQLMGPNMNLPPFLFELMAELRQIALSENLDITGLTQEFWLSANQKNYAQLGKWVLELCGKNSDNQGKCAHYVWNFLRMYMDAEEVQLEETDQMVCDFLRQIHSNVLLKTLTYTEEQDDLIDFVLFNLPTDTRFNSILFTLLESSNTTVEKKDRLFDSIASFPSVYKFCMYFEWLLKEGKMAKHAVVDQFVSQFMGLPAETQTGIGNQMDTSVLFPVISYCAEKELYQMIDALFFAMSSSKMGVVVQGILHNGIERKVDEGFFFDDVETDEELLERIFPKDKLDPMVYHRLQSTAFPGKEPGLIDYVTGYFTYMGEYLKEHLDEYVAGFLIGTVEAFPIVDILNKIQTYMTGIAGFIATFTKSPLEVLKKILSASFDNFLNIKKFLSIDKKPYQAAKDSIGFLWTVLAARFPGLPKTLVKPLGKLAPKKNKTKDKPSVKKSLVEKIFLKNRIERFELIWNQHKTKLGKLKNTVSLKLNNLNLTVYNLLYGDVSKSKILSGLTRKSSKKINDLFTTVSQKMESYRDVFRDKFGSKSKKELCTESKKYWQNGVTDKLSQVGEELGRLLDEVAGKLPSLRKVGGKTKDFIIEKLDPGFKKNMGQEFKDALKFDEPVSLTFAERKQAGRELVSDLVESKIQKSVVDSQRLPILFDFDTEQIMNDPEEMKRFEEELNKSPDSFAYMFYYNIYKKYAQVVKANGDSPLSLVELVLVLYLHHALCSDKDSDTPKEND